MTLVEFLTARLDEDERAALAVQHWAGVRVESATEAEPAHIARHDPGRVLADVVAKRSTIEYVSRWGHDDPDGGGYYSCPLVPGSSRALDDEWDGQSCWCGLAARQLAILGPLALPFAEHPDYREEFAP